LTIAQDGKLFFQNKPVERKEEEITKMVKDFRKQHV